MGLTTAVKLSSAVTVVDNPMKYFHHEQITVNVDNYVRAETAAQIDRFLKLTGGVNQWHHNRQPTPLDKQNVIRMNRDTIYSFAVVDISKGAILTLPDPGRR